MIKYPLYVTFDTNILDENQYDFSESGTLSLLSKYVEQGKIKVVLSNIVCNEIKRHLCNRAKEITSLLNNVLKDIKKTTSKSFICFIGYGDRIEKKNTEEAQKKAVECFDNYLESLNPEILDNRDVDTESIFNAYFSYLPPFENNDKKRNEFPDAFIANQIKKRFGTDETVAIISKDKGFKSACGDSESHLFFCSFGELFDAISRQDEQDYKTTTTLVTITYKDTICSRIKELLMNGDNVSITGMSVDRDGIIEGTEYDETYIEKVSGISYRLHTIDQISNEKFYVTLNTQAEVTSYCSYEDYDNAAWDSEERKYVYLETIELRETHRARFAVRVIIDKESDEIIVQMGIVLLGPSTRISQEDISYDRYLQDIEDQNRKSCGLTTFGGYDDLLERDFANSKMKEEICEQFERINDIISEYEDAVSVYYDLLEMKDIDLKTTIALLDQIVTDIEHFPDINDNEKLSQDDIDSFKDWVKDKLEKMSKMADIKRLSDDFSFGDNIEITDGNENYMLSIEGIEGLSPSAGQEELISIALTCADETASGYIKVTEGYMHFDEDGGIADALSDDIEYYYDEILNCLKGIVDDFEKRANVELDLAKTLRESILSASDYCV